MPVHHLRCRYPGFIVFIAVVWVIQEFTSFHVLKYVILFIGETEDVVQSCSLYFNFWNANCMLEI
jgi:hypothetical protein